MSDYWSVYQWAVAAWAAVAGFASVLALGAMAVGVDMTRFQTPMTSRDYLIKFAVFFMVLFALIKGGFWS